MHEGALPYQGRLGGFCFSAGERRGLLCVIASPDGRSGSLRIPQDAMVHSALLEPGQHIVHELALGRSAWIHLVDGEVAFGELIMAAGDAAGISEDRAVSFTARERSEILLLDLQVPSDDDPADGDTSPRTASCGRKGIHQIDGPSLQGGSPSS